MTFADGKMPPSTDLVKLRAPLPTLGRLPRGVSVDCTLCGDFLGHALFLNEAIKLWTDHQEGQRSLHPVVVANDSEQRDSD